MKLTTTTLVSVDGVMQGPGAPDEDRRGGFERGGWSRSMSTRRPWRSSSRSTSAPAFLLGRRTYEVFAGSWGAMADRGDKPVAVALNTMPKYVASTTLSDPRCTNTTVVSGDIAAAVAELKAEPGRELQVPTGRPQYSTASPTEARDMDISRPRTSD
jgi:dihydrofolate reductase